MLRGMGSEHGSAVAIVLAAGAGRRVGAEEPKAFLPIGGHPILAVAVGAAAASPVVDSVVVAAPEGWEERARECVRGCAVPVAVVTGGATRQASVGAALAALPEGTRLVAIHDAARPFAPPDLFTAVVDAVSVRAPGAVPVVPVSDTVKEVVEGRVVGTLDRDRLALAQTPQAFDVEVLRAAHRRAEDAGAVLTDDAAALERDGVVVVAVPGDPSNVKITTLFDLANADARMGGSGG
jgi:2-C-methyl-D-erythritol 4-phosphate cytidylyltransferase